MQYRNNMKCGRDGCCYEWASRRPLQGDNRHVRRGHWDQIPATALGGFSLLELLLVAAILVVLASLYFGPSGSSRQRALQAACQKNLQKLYIAMEIYSHDFNENFPKVPGARTSAEALGVLVPRYTSDTSAFICPASDDSPISDESLGKHKISYAYYMGRAMT